MIGWEPLLAPLRRSRWNLSTQMREPSDLHEHLSELLDLVEPVRESLLSLTADGYGMDWFCFVEAAALEHAVELDQHLMSRLAVFPGSLLIDTYGAEDDDE
jgi:hypothetical protein